MFLITISEVFAIDIYSESAVLYNLNDNEIIYEKNKDNIMQIASLTKIVTAITIIENTPDLNKEVIITYEMISDLDGYAKAGLKVGDKLTYNELLYLLMLPSAADAAKALAIDSSGSVLEFSNLMNDEVKKIGVTNTHFDNPIGMDSLDNYSTADDLALILMYALKNDTFRQFYEAKEEYIESINYVAYNSIVKTGQNNNISTKLIRGSKTGFTYDAGLCLSSIASINGVDYLFVTLNSPIDYPYNLLDAINIYTYYSENYAYHDIVNKDDLITTLEIKNGKVETYNIYANVDMNKYLNNEFDKSKVEYRYNGVYLITKDIKKGDLLGEVKIIYEDTELGSFNVYLNDDIEYKKDLKPLYILIILTIIILLLLIIRIIKLKRKTKRKKKNSK